MKDQSILVGIVCDHDFITVQIVHRSLLVHTHTHFHRMQPHLLACWTQFPFLRFFSIRFFPHKQAHTYLIVYWITYGSLFFQHIETVLWFCSSFSFHSVFHLIELNFNKLPSISLHYLCMCMWVCALMHVLSVKRIFKRSSLAKWVTRHFDMHKLLYWMKCWSI